MTKKGENCGISKIFEKIFLSSIFQSAFIIFSCVIRGVRGKVNSSVTVTNYLPDKYLSYKKETILLFSVDSFFHTFLWKLISVSKMKRPSLILFLFAVASLGVFFAVSGVLADEIGDGKEKDVGMELRKQLFIIERQLSREANKNSVFDEIKKAAQGKTPEDGDKIDQPVERGDGAKKDSGGDSKELYSHKFFTT